MGSFKKVLCFSSIIAISACGGGGGGGSSNEGGSGGGSTNSAPEFVSASEVTTEENSTGTLLTLSASDANGDSISYNTIGGEDQSRFLIDNGNQLRFGFAPDFENPADADGDNIYQVTIEASDGNGGQMSQEIVVTVTNVNDGAPEFSSATEVTVEEDVSGVFYTAMAQDPDGDEVTFSLSDDADTALFSIDSASGELSFNTAPDFESPADSDKDNYYQLSISAADSEGVDNQLTLQVSVTDLVIPSPRMVFPTAGANMGGKLSSLALTTRVLDLESGENTTEQLSSITIDSQSPIMDATSSSIWYLDSTVDKGRDSYILSAQFVSGETVQSFHSVKNELLIHWPVGVSYDNLYGSRYFADTGLNMIFEIDFTSTRREISGPSVGSGPSLNPIDMVQKFPTVRANPADDYFVVLNRDGSIYSVQRTTGNRTQLSTWVPADLTSLALTGYGGIAYATRAQGSYGEIIEFDLLNGGYSVISSSNSSSPIGAGADMIYPKGIALDEPNGQLYVGDDSTDSILRIDIASGDRTTISGNGIGSGEPVSQPEGLIVDVDSGKIYVTNGQVQNILQVDISTGDRTVVTDWTKGEGLRLVNPQSISQGVSSDSLLVSGILFDPVIMSVDINTGDRTEISSNHVGTGPSYVWNHISYNRKTDRLLTVVVDSSIAAEIDLQNGNRTIAAEFIPPASARIRPSAIVPDDSGQYAYIFDESNDELIKLDLESGEFESISAPGIGEGPAFSGGVEAMELDATNNHMVLLQDTGLVSVDLDSGDREVISDNNTGIGPSFDSANGLALDLTNNRAFVSDYGTGGIWQVELTTGEISTFVSSVNGGTADMDPHDVVLDTIGNRLLVGTRSGNLVAIDMDDFSQSILSSGKGCDSDCRGDGIEVESLSSMAIDTEGRRLFAYDGGSNGVQGVVVIDLRSGQRALASK
ncbi:Ig-like domain-containing protein [Microbulbifer sp. ZKSA002]|uniref:Ig-like domain-containing protein n=1 Tax=Microbulbifer sp. ZKSA002 TaxID=3243388 RepID=UPI0040390D6A